MADSIKLAQDGSVTILTPGGVQFKLDGPAPKDRHPVSIAITLCPKCAENARYVLGGSKKGDADG